VFKFYGVYQRCVLLGRPERANVFFLFSPRDLRAPSVDRREALPRDRKVLPFDNPGPKIWGPSPHKKSWGQKRAKLESTSDHVKLQSRISPERMEISKIGKICGSTAIPPAFGEKSRVNFGPLTIPF